MEKLNIREKCLGFAIGDRIEMTVSMEWQGIFVGDTGVIAGITSDFISREGLNFYINMDKPMKSQVFFINPEWEAMKYVLVDGHGILIHSAAVHQIRIIEKGLKI